MNAANSNCNIKVCMIFLNILVMCSAPFPNANWIAHARHILCGLVWLIICLQVDWEEYYAHYVKTILRLDAGTIQELRTSPHTVSRQIKVLTLMKKKIKIFLIGKEVQGGAVAKSYMRKGFLLIYEEMCKYFPIYEEAASHI